MIIESLGLCYHLSCFKVRVWTPGDGARHRPLYLKTKSFSLITNLVHLGVLILQA